MMSTKELARLAVITGAIDGVYTAKQAARKLGVSSRWVKSLKKVVREQGDGALIHGNAHAASDYRYRRSDTEKDNRFETE